MSDEDLKYNWILKEILMKRNITQKQLAIGAKVNYSSLSRIMKGRMNATGDEKRAIAGFLKVEVGEIFKD